jgi:hypothetical protein
VIAGSPWSALLASDRAWRIEVASVQKTTTGTTEDVVRRLLAPFTIIISLTWDVGRDSVAAYQPKSTAPVNMSTAGLAMRGYDPVAYFVVAKPTPGNAAHTSIHDGAIFRFESAANKSLFDAEPAKYAPQFGGFCAYAVANGYKYDADPTVWAIVDGKLYVNYNTAVSLLWRARRESHIKTGHEQWRSVRALPAR